MDVLNDPHIHTIVLKWPAQVGKSEIILNIIGYFIDQDPCPGLVVQPTITIAEWWSKRRLAPMLAETPCLRGKVRDIRTRDSDNTILEKGFPGGSLSIGGANSPSGLASRPVRFVFNDETDRYPPSAGTEGNPIELSKKRSTTFWNRKHVEASTPTIKGLSYIDEAYELSDQRQYHVPCPHCNHYQVLRWSRETVRWPEGKPQLAVYICEHCQGEITDRHKPTMLARGRWVARRETNGVAGFHLNELYSPWVSFGEMATNFVKAKRLPDTLQVWINTALAEVWEDRGGETVEDRPLFERREVYPCAVPAGALFLTAGVDVQEDRLEAEVVGWGEDEESWGIEHAVLWGDPRRAQVWKELDDWLLMERQHDSGAKLRPLACAIDSGFLTDEVYAFCRPRWSRRIFPTKGYGDFGRPMIGKSSRARRVRLFPIGVSAAKDLLYGRLKIAEPGPGYCHFPVSYDEDFFYQLTAEKAINVWEKGKRIRRWILKGAHRRNEALDVRVLALVARQLVRPNIKALLDRLKTRAADEPQAAPPTDEEKAKEHKRVIRRRRRGYIYRGWK